MACGAWAATPVTHLELETQLMGEVLPRPSSGTRHVDGVNDMPKRTAGPARPAQGGTGAAWGKPTQSPAWQRWAGIQAKWRAAAQLMRAWAALLAAAPALGGQETFRYDLVDVGRQALSKRATAMWQARRPAGLGPTLVRQSDSGLALCRPAGGETSARPPGGGLPCADVLKVLLRWGPPAGISRDQRPCESQAPRCADGPPMRQDLVGAYGAADLDRVSAAGARLLALLDDMEQLLATNRCGPARRRCTADHKVRAGSLSAYVAAEQRASDARWPARRPPAAWPARGRHGSRGLRRGWRAPTLPTMLVSLYLVNF